MYISSKGTKRKLQDEYPDSSENEDAADFDDIQKLDELVEINDKAAITKPAITKPTVMKHNVSKAVVPKVEPKTEPVKKREIQKMKRNQLSPLK